MRKSLLTNLVMFCLLSASSVWAAESLEQVELYFLGQKFSSEPIAQRIQRLEQATGNAAPPAASVDYRKNRLLALAHGQASEEAQHRAIQAYNRGVDQSAQGHIEQAIASYQEAIAQNPHLVQAYNNMANLYEQTQRIPEALATYQAALRYSPNDALLHRNLGIMYERSGNVKAALEEFRAYLKLSPEGSDPVIAGIVQEFSQRWSERDTGEDYAAVASASSEGRLLAWPKQLQPVPVYIDVTDAQQAAFLPIVREAFSAWESASGQKLRFREVPRAEQARIHLTLRSGPLTHASENIGHARYQASDQPRKLFETLRVFITLNTGDNPAVSVEQRKRQVNRVALHELGHALGIWGHSANPDDIMYTHPMVSGLSERDTKTIQKLYAAPITQAKY